MVEKLSKKEIKKKIDEGYIRTIVLYELIGNPKEHIEKTMRVFLDNIASDEQIIVLREEVEETIELENGLFSSAAEVEYLILGLEKLTWLAFNFMPASIEIKEPKELTFREKDLTLWLNDLLSKLHEVNTAHAAIKNENQALVRNINALVRNSVLLAMKPEEKLTAKEIGKRVGIAPDQLMPFLEAMIKEDKLEHKNHKFWKKTNK